MQDVSKFIALTGRVQSYTEQLNNGNSNSLMPVSCSIKKYRNDIFDAIKYLSIALRGGAGICVNLDDFKARQPQVDKQYFFYLPEDHPDYVDLTDEQKLRLFILNDSNRNEGDYIVISVNDSMEESVDAFVSIEQSWKSFIEVIESSNIPVIDLSRLRPKGIDNGKGLTSSGAVSFLTIYEAILNHINKGDLISFMKLCGQMNEVLRRGGNFKNGIVTFSLIYTHPDIIKYLNVPLADIPGSGKKGIIVDSDILQDKRLMKLVEVRVNDKSLMLEKTIYKVDCGYEERGGVNYEIGVPLKDIEVNYFGINYSIERLYSQVCKEIILADKATCLLLHINGGQIEKIEDIVPAFKEIAYLGCDLWKRWKNEVGGRASQYLSAEEDRQIGIGWIGLANMLAHFDIKYLDFIRAGETYLNDDFYLQNKIEWQLFNAIHEGYQAAAEIGREVGLERMFTIAPTQSCAFRYQDLDGNTVCKQINPPLDRRVRRTSHTVDKLAGFYYYGNKVETIKEFIQSNGVDAVQRLWELFQRLMNTTGMAHCMSFDLYREIDEEWLRDFMLRSPLVTTYYQLADKVDQSYLNKAVANTAVSENEKAFCAINNPGECAACAE
jgi:hypothetical protein